MLFMTGDDIYLSYTMPVKPAVLLYIILYRVLQTLHSTKACMVLSLLHGMA